MKVLYTCRAPIFAGAENSLSTLLESVDRKIIDPVLCFDFPMPHQRRYDAANVAIAYRHARLPFWRISHRLGRPVRGYGRLEQHLHARKLGRILRDCRPDIFHVNLLCSASSYDLSVAKGMGIPTVGHLRTLGSFARVRKSTLRLCDAVICVSERAKRDVDSWSGGKNAIVVYNPIDSARFQHGGQAEAARRSFGIPSESIVLSSVGILTHQKGHDLAIKAHAQLLEHYPNVVLLISGGAFQRSNDISESLRALVRELGTQESVRFLGHVSNMSEVLAASNVIYALSRIGESFGRVPLEAAAAQRPVIGTNVGATPEILLHEKTGLLVPPDDVDAVVRSTQRLLECEEETKEFVETAFCRVQRDFSPDAHARAVESVYGALLNSTGCHATVTARGAT